MRISELRYVLTWPPQGEVALWLSIPGSRRAVGIGFHSGPDEEFATYWIADQVQEFLVESLRVCGRLRAWPRALRGGSPMWAAIYEDEAVWESADRSERYRIGELPGGR